MKKIYFANSRSVANVSRRDRSAGEGLRFGGEVEPRGTRINERQLQITAALKMSL